MRILHIVTSLQTGGAETLIVNLMPRFRDLGHKVGLVVFNGQHTALMERLEKECPECIIYKLGTSYYNPWYIVKLIGIMKKYDIVHTHNSSPQLFAAIANFFAQKKLITTEHNTSNRRRYWKWYVNVDRCMYSRYNRIICISHQAEENLRNYLKRDKLPIVTIFNGVDVESFHNAKPLEELKRDKFVAIMVAGFRKQKDQDTLVRAIAKLPKGEYELWLVGTGERFDDVKKLAKDLNIQDYVKFLGLRTDVARLLHTADIVVMSSHYEGLSLSNIEGMSVDKPFIASDVDGLHEITEGFGILFPHEDPDALSKIIERLSTDKEYYNKIATSCYNRAQQFDIAKMVERYERVYLEQEY